MDTETFDNPTSVFKKGSIEPFSQNDSYSKIESQSVLAENTEECPKVYKELNANILKISIESGIKCSESFELENVNGTQIINQDIGNQTFDRNPSFSAVSLYTPVKDIKELFDANNVEQFSSRGTSPSSPNPSDYDSDEYMKMRVRKANEKFSKEDNGCDYLERRNSKVHFNDMLASESEEPEVCLLNFDKEKYDMNINEYPRNTFIEHIDDEKVQNLNSFSLQKRNDNLESNQQNNPEKWNPENENNKEKALLSFSSKTEKSSTQLNISADQSVQEQTKIVLCTFEMEDKDKLEDSFELTGFSINFNESHTVLDEINSFSLNKNKVISVKQKIKDSKNFLSIVNQNVQERTPSIIDLREEVKKTEAKEEIKAILKADKNVKNKDSISQKDWLVGKQNEELKARERRLEIEKKQKAEIKKREIKLQLERKEKFAKWIERKAYQKQLEIEIVKHEVEEQFRYGKKNARPREARKAFKKWLRGKQTQKRREETEANVKAEITKAVMIYCRRSQQIREADDLANKHGYAPIDYTTINF